MKKSFILVFLSTLLVSSSYLYAGPVKKALCQQFYWGKSVSTVFDALEQQALRKFLKPPSDYIVYLKKYFPGYTDGEFLILMTFLRQDDFVMSRSSHEGSWMSEKFTAIIQARRVIKASGVNALTAENMILLAEYILSQHIGVGEVLQIFLKGSEQGLDFPAIIKLLPKI